jgi:hypothetical protein
MLKEIVVIRGHKKEINMKEKIFLLLVKIKNKPMKENARIIKPHCSIDNSLATIGKSYAVILVKKEI